MSIKVVNIEELHSETKTVKYSDLGSTLTRKVVVDEETINHLRGRFYGIFNGLTRTFLIFG